MTDVVTVWTSERPVPGPLTLAAGWWAGGLTLAERCSLPGTPSPAPDAGQRSERRLARWREAHGLAASGQFDRRLAALPITGTGLAGLLGESRESLAGRELRPGWAELVEEVLARVPTPRPVPSPAGPEPVAWQAGFSTIVAPFVDFGWERLTAAVAPAGPADHAELAELADLAELRGDFAGGLGANLVSLAGRTLVLELNVLRVTGRLIGEAPQQRFWSFVRHFAQRSGLAALLAEYPVLARLLAQATDHAVESWLELLRRFAADRPRIVAGIFGGTDPGRLVEVAIGRGDPHQRGRSVALLRFQDGGRLVYKPRPLGVHVHFNECLDWLNRIVPELGLRRLAVLDRSGYGWVEFAEHRPCADRPGVERYFRRQGALLALLYALDGVDFHFENVVASGDQPVLVDLEALLHPALPAAGPELITGDPARAAYERSVARVGLLPSLVFGEDRTVLDLGGSGGDAGAPMPFKTAGWAAPGTDEMRLVREQPAFPGSQNRPRLDDVEVDPAGYAAELLAGFRDAYDAIAGDREALTGPAGLLAGFATDELRVVARPSRTYAMLLHESTHPDVLRDALDRDRILDYLWALSAGDPARERLVEHERRELWNGDIPLFSTRPGSRDLWTGVADRLPDLLAETGLERATGTIQAMGRAGRDIQEWIIQASFATRRATTSPREPAPATTARSPAPAAGLDPARALAAARAVGDRLVDTAYRNRDRVGWLGLRFVDDERWLVEPIGYDLYGGYPGVAVYLSQLARLTGEQRYAELAHQALAPIERYVATLTGTPPTGSQCSAFNALSGLAYALVQVGTNVGAPELLAPVEPLVALLTPGIDEDEVLDVIGGSAGGMVAMLAVHRVTGSPAAFAAARACADRLVAAFPGVSRPLTGFSHGAAGIGWALLRFAAATGEQPYAEAGLAAFRYERSHYSPALRNWPDLRAASGPASAMSAWCHGAPGIGLARADCVLIDPEVTADLARAINGLLAAGPAGNLSLCHGELGNLELLTVAAPELPERAAWAAAAVSTLERSGPACGTPGGIQTPGLMVGLAGIGHGLLRLGFPDRVPSLLLLQPPEAQL